MAAVQRQVNSSSLDDGEGLPGKRADELQAAAMGGDNVLGARALELLCRQPARCLARQEREHTQGGLAVTFPVGAGPVNSGDTVTDISSTCSSP